MVTCAGLGLRPRDSRLHWPAAHSHFCQWLWGMLFLKGGLAPPKDRASVHPFCTAHKLFQFLEGALAAPSPACGALPMCALVPQLRSDPAAGSREQRVTGLPQAPALLEQLLPRDRGNVPTGPS